MTTADAVRRLVERGVLSADQAEAVREELALSHRLRRAPLAEVAGYLGGGLTLTGIVLLVASTWQRLSEFSRTLLVGGSAVLLLFAGVVVAGGLVRMVRRDVGAVRARLSGVLLGLAAVAVVMTVGIALPAESGRWGLAGSFASGLVVAAAAYALLPTVAGLIAMAGLGFTTVVSFVDAIAGVGPLVMGLALCGYGVVLTAAALGGLLRERPVGVGIGLGISIFGAQQPLGGDGTAPWAYLLTLAIGVGCFLLYRWQRTWVPLVAGIVAVTLAVPEAVWDFTGGELAGAVLVLVAGAVLLIASGLGLRLGKHD
ncbi:DUF2157 domain-containing protein [Amycolatopsis sp. NPDC059657]|uniref:DUF2157 domain-containing protein n=1 Tax=Amycolatopsis sp. NPDC059657 TaxID=3346899 RepID=UPI00366B0D53